MKYLKLIFIVAFISAATSLYATQIKTISSHEGITNNAILCMHQNSLGHIYIGTVDGLNIWDGHAMEIFQAADGNNYFFGNQIKYILPYKEDKIVLLTQYGLAIVNMTSREVEFHKEYAFTERIAIGRNDEIYGFRNNRLFHFDIETGKYAAFSEFNIAKDNLCHRISVLPNGSICLFTSEDIYLLKMDDSGMTPVIHEIRNLGIKCRFAGVCHDGLHNYIITQDNRVCTFDIHTETITDISPIELGDLEEDTISGMIHDETGLYISFRQNGVYFLPNGESRLEQTDIDCGVFSIIPDKLQPIIWVGTDCNGLLRWCEEATDITSITFEDLPYSIEMPVRSIHMDEEGDLWFGTKGDGLYRIRKFRTTSHFDTSNTDRFAVENSSLTHNSVYTLTKSDSHGFLWIGTEGNGINIVQPDKGRIEKVKGSDRLSFVHAIIEENDSTIWVATDSRGAYRCRFGMENRRPVIFQTDTLDFSEPFNYNTSIFTMAFQNDSTIWFGSRGNGALAYNIQTGSSRIIKFPTDNGFAVNETFHIAMSKIMLFATGNGLVSYDPQTDSAKLSGHIPNKAMHSILIDNEENIWVASNSGITSLDSDLNYRTSFDRFSGIDVLEYSDGACFYDSAYNTLYFGGINGITVIRNGLSEHLEYNPEIHITNFIQNNQFSHISTKIKKGKLRIPYSKSIFAIEFSVVDNLNYSDYQFSYNIEGFNDEWTFNNSNIIYMPSLIPGNYTLRIRYLNQSTMYQSEECTLPIYIVPPFYLRWWALPAYALLIAFIIYKLVRYNRYKYTAMKEKIQKQYSDRLLKIKTETTNNITDELSVQITFILGLCQQIRHQTQNNSLIADKVNLLEYNIAKINRILHILNEYKGISENIANPREVALVPISHLAKEMLEIITPNIQNRQVTILHDIEPDIIMATSKEAFLTILNSLIYKAISIAQGDKTVNLKINGREKGGINMDVTISTKEETYSEFINVLEKEETGTEFEVTLFSILIKKLGGSIVYGYDKSSSCMSIKVSIPQHNIEENRLRFEDSFISENIITYNSITENMFPDNSKPNTRFEYIHIISNKKDVSSFLGYFMSNRYNILDFTDSGSALEKMMEQPPVAVIYDTSSVAQGFAEFMEKTREHKRTCHIPVIALTSSLQPTDREECIKLGADMCLTFPFNIEYLNSALEKMLNIRESIAEYYKSPISAYTIDSGKILHQDDRAFLNKVMDIINDNISNPDLTAVKIASELGMSIRVMYRRLEGITDRKLHHIIRKSRMELAVNLLSSSKLTIDEIMYKVGYDNRSTFYRNFKEAKGMTPKEYREKVKDNIIQSLSPAEK
ncbi:MAG: helix-turn-helix domain-containing protein [Bacteroidales bacterium]|nr:helix-turn-helix domain-containing protein [Bacteroidales bacterium]